MRPLLSLSGFLKMSLHARLIALRKQRGLTQPQMASACGIHVNSIKKYESGHGLPSLDALKKIARALHVSTDFLLFEEQERGPSQELALQFEAISQMPPDDQDAVLRLIDAMIVKHKVEHAVRAATATTTKKAS